MENVGCMLLSDVVRRSYRDVPGLHVHIAPSPIANPSAQASAHALQKGNGIGKAKSLLLTVGTCGGFVAEMLSSIAMIFHPVFLGKGVICLHALGS